jgi:FkbM family methyltransferase
MLSSIRSTIRPILNLFRSVNKLQFLEKALAKKTKGKTIKNFWVKLLPPVESYSRGSIREVERNGIRYRLDISDYLEYVIYFGIDAEPKTALYKSVADGMYVFDIGTNMGETLLNFAQRNKTGKNFGFEPVPFLYEKAKENIARNNFSNIHLNNLAVSNEQGELFFEVPKNRNFGSISMSHQPTTDSKKVKAITLDAYIKENNIEKVDFIKIDVEGFESNVLNGAPETIKKYKPILFVEVVDDYLKTKGSSAGALIQQIRSFGYDVKNAEDSSEIGPNHRMEDLRLDILCHPVN